MNKKEIDKVLKIISSADGGCPFCVKDILDFFVLEFPEYKDNTKPYYEKVDESFKEHGVKHG